MELIERYIYAVTRYLPEESREDVGLELRANILDMLPENHSHEDIRLVLEELGDPKKLAEQYNTNKRYLIGPGFYDSYIYVLKLVVSIVVAVSLGVTLVSWLFQAPVNWYEAPHIGELIRDVLTAVVGGAFQAALWVTVVFVILERVGVEADILSAHGDTWMVEYLPEIPDERSIISRGETIVSLVFSIVLVVLLYFRPELIGIHVRDGGDAVISYGLLDQGRLAFYLPFIILVTLAELTFLAWSFVTKRWTRNLAILNAIVNLGVIVLVIAMLSDPALINGEFNEVIAAMLDSTVSIVTVWVDRTKLILGIVIVVINVWEATTAFYKARRMPTQTAPI